MELEILLAVLSTACALGAALAAVSCAAHAKRAHESAARLTKHVGDVLTMMDDIDKLTHRVRKLHGAVYGRRGGRPSNDDQPFEEDDDVDEEFRRLRAFQAAAPQR